MKKSPLILAIMLVQVLSLRAQDISEEQFRSAILEFSANINAVDCDFTQTKESPMLSKPIVSSGHMTYRKPEYLEWSYLQPVPISVIVERKQISIKKDGKTETLGGSQVKHIREISEMIIENIEGRSLLNESLFQIKYDKKGGLIIVSFFPKKKEMQKIWSKLLIFYEHKSLKVTAFELHETSGGLTSIIFSKIKYEFSK